MDDEPAAAALCIHTPPRLSRDCLLALRDVLDTVLSLAGEDAEPTYQRTTQVQAPMLAR